MPFFASSSSRSLLPSIGTIVDTVLVPSLSLAVAFEGISALNVTDATLPLPTFWVNSEYATSDGCEARGLKLWNTVSNTTAMTTQSSRFLAMSFIMRFLRKRPRDPAWTSHEKRRSSGINRT